jgi:ribose transport system substrate-binding protein
MKKILALLLVSVLMFSLIGCGGNDNNAQAPAGGAGTAATESAGTPAAGGQTFKAGFITQAMSNESQAFSWKEFQRLAPEFGFEMQVFAGENDPQVEVAGIEQCIAEGYHAIFVNPSSADAVIPALMQAKEAGIIIGMFSSDLPEDAQHLRDFFCGTDDTMAGEQAAAAFVTAFPNGAKVVEVGGQAGHDAQIKRATGFRKGIEGTGIEIIDSQNCPGGWNTHEALAIMEDFIARHGTEIQGVFCHWDNGASGVIQALHNAGMTDVFVAGVDGNRTGYQQVRDGTQQLCVGQSFTNMARQSLQNAKDILEGKSVMPLHFIPLDIVTADTIDNFPPPEW